MGIKSPKTGDRCNDLFITTQLDLLLLSDCFRKVVFMSYSLRGIVCPYDDFQA